jgi:hypothetical protein
MALLFTVIAVALVILGLAFAGIYCLNKAVDQSDR